MNVLFTARKVTLKDSFKELVEKKLSKFDRIFHSDCDAKVVVTAEGHRETVEITIHGSSGLIYRAESSCREMTESLDDCMHALSRQMRRHKTKISKKVHHDNDILTHIESVTDDFEGHSENDFAIVKEKTIDLKPCSSEEAIMQMELLNHNFFVFRNSETNDINVVYKRHDGDYGLIIPN